MKFFFNKKNIIFLISVCVLFFVLRFPSLFEPNWYGDEGIYQVVGNAISEGRILYAGAWDNKPPIIYIIYAILQSDLFLIKFLSLLCGIASVVVMFALSKKLFKSETTSYIVTAIYSLLFATPILEGNIANAENFMLLPTMLAGYLIFLSTKDKKNIKIYLISGLLLSISLATKIVTIFDFTAFLIFLLFIEQKINMALVKRVSVFFVAFISLMIIFSLYFLFAGAFKDFINGVFLQNVSYVGEQYGSPFPVGALFIKTLLLFIYVCLIYIFKTKISKETLFIYIWLGFGIYSVFFSDRPYTHYLLVMLPPFTLLIGNFIEQSRKAKIFELMLIISTSYIAYSHFQVYQKNIRYYQNFMSFILGSKSVSSYYSFFDRNTPRDYAVSEFIKRNTTDNETIFLMSDSAQIYQLSDKLPIGKYVVYYHVTYYPGADKETEQEINSKKPKFIIKTVDESRVLKPLLSSYELKYIIEGAQIYERQI